jgi:SAM-dependent methyltransferase
MTRFTPGFFDSIYQETPPWEVGKAQPALAELLDAHPPVGPALDIGCGTGDLAIDLAQRGLDVLGIDIVEAAVAQARAKAAALAPEAAGRAEFRVADALRPSLLGQRFGTVTDSGFYHLFESDQRDGLVDELAATLLPGGRYYLLAFATEFPMPNTPRKVSEDELRARFAVEKGWRILALRPAEFQSRIAPVPAVAACIQRLPADAA